MLTPRGLDAPRTPPTRSPSTVRLEPLHTPHSPGWKAERSKLLTPTTTTVKDALTYLNKRVLRQQLLTTVDTFKGAVSAAIADARQAGTPDEGIISTLRAQMKEIGSAGGFRVKDDATVRFLDFGSSPVGMPCSPSVPQLAPITVGKIKKPRTPRSTITFTLDFLRARTISRAAAVEAEKVSTFKAALSQAQEKAKVDGVPDYLIEDALGEKLDEVEKA